jgi:hypothetical protein
MCYNHREFQAEYDRKSKSVMRLVVIGILLGTLAALMTGCGAQVTPVTVIVVPTPKPTFAPLTGDTGLVCQISCSCGAIDSIDCGPDLRGKTVPSVGDACPCSAGVDSCHVGF